MHLCAHAWLCDSRIAVLAGEHGCGLGLAGSSKTSSSVWFHINWFCFQRLVENWWGLGLVWQDTAKSILAFFWLLRNFLNHLIWQNDWILLKKKKKKKGKKARRKWDHFNSYHVVGYRRSKCLCVTVWCTAGSSAGPGGKTLQAKSWFWSCLCKLEAFQPGEG